MPDGFAVLSDLEPGGPVEMLVRAGGLTAPSRRRVRRGPIEAGCLSLLADGDAVLVGLRIAPLRLPVRVALYPRNKSELFVQTDRGASWMTADGELLLNEPGRDRH